MGARAPSAGGPALLAFDFDWSLLEENSDTFVIRELGADALYEASKGMPWTQRMDWVLKEAASQLGRTQADVLAALHRAPLHPELAGLLRTVAAKRAGRDAGSSRSGSVDDLDIVILSDANTVYIDAILEHHGLRQHIQEVHTNPAEWREGALRVGPYHARPHGCHHCPSNLCKGQVLAGLLERQAACGRAYSRVLYVGDGRGDYCPSALLLHGSGSGSGSDRNASTSGGGGNGAPAAAAAGAAKPGSSSAGAAAPVPCGSGSNLVYARVEYPDGVPCSLWVMLQQAHSVHSSDGSGASAGTPHQASAAAAGQAGAAGEAAAHQGVVAWTTPEQLAALLSAELQLELEQ